MFILKRSRFVVLLLTVFTVTSLGFLTDVLAKAKGRDSGGSNQTTLSSVQLEKIKTLNNQSADFYEFLLRYQGQFVPKNLLNQEVRNLEKETEQYLSSAQILFQKEIRTLEDVQFEGAAIEKISFAVYEIKNVVGDDESLDENARFIKSVLSQPYMQKNKLILNPFLQVERSGIQGFFESKNKKIEVGITALSYRVFGLGDTLAHELRHAEEQWKIENAQSSLASWILRGLAVDDDPYSEFLRLDEIQTHRMDIQFLTEQAPLLEKNNPDPSKLKGMREFRQQTLDFKKVMLQNMEDRARSSLYWLMTAQAEGKVIWQCAKIQAPLMRCKAADLSGAQAQTVEVQFSLQLGSSVNEIILNLIYEAVGFVEGAS